MTRSWRKLALTTVVASSAVVLGASTLLTGEGIAGASAPSISSFTPSSGPVGTKVTLQGTGFTPGPVKVSFHGVTAPGPVVNAAGTRIVVRVPPLASTGTIAVTTADGRGAQSTTAFQVTYGATISPKKLFRGQPARISGSAFPAHTDVVISLDGHRFTGVGTDVNGNFTLLRALPPDLKPGPSHTMAITCPSRDCVPLQKLAFSIFSDWPMSRYDAGQTANNSAEWLFNSSDLYVLNHSSSAIGAGGYTGSVVEGGGKLIATLTSGGQDAQTHVIALPDGGKGSWDGDTDAPWSAPAAVAGNMVYVVSPDMLYAFALKPPSSDCNIFVCNPIWTAPLGSLGAGAPADPYAPVVADGHVYVTGAANGLLYAFDANGVTDCSGTPTVCQPLWTQLSTNDKIYGPPAVAPASAGGNGDVYVTAKVNGNNRVIAFQSNGITDYLGDVLSETSLSGPALANGRIVVTGWEAGTSTASLLAVGQNAGHLLWQSIGLGGGVPPAPAVTPAYAYAANSVGRLYAFKFASCTTSPCQPVWTSVKEGAGHNEPPTVANGVVFLPATTQSDGTDLIYAFDANGVYGCSGVPKTCTAIWNTNFGVVQAGSQVSVFAGQVWSVGTGKLLEESS